MAVGASDFDFGTIIGEVARLLLDKPNPHHSSAKELRYGDRGALAIDLEKGVWTDFSNDHASVNSGGCLDLIKREKGLEHGSAVEWLIAQGFPIPDTNAKAAVSPPPAKAKIECTYDYVDENGEFLFQVVRFEPKDFRQRRRDASQRDGWSWSVKGCRLVPYRFPELIEALAMGRTVFLVEGEKDVDNLADIGVPATCNPMGAGKWPTDFNQFFNGSDVVIMRDNDESGKNHTILVGSNLEGVAASIRVVDPPGVPPKGDISDWLEAHPGSVFTFHEMVEKEAKLWTKAPPASRFGAVMWSSLDVVSSRQDWLIEDVLFAGDSCLVYGESQSGKSFLACDAALSVSRGVDFLGKKTAKGGVIYQAGEGGKGLIKRLKAYRAHHEIKDELPFVLLTSKVDLYGKNGDAEAFLQEILAWKTVMSEPLSLLVIDTFSTASPGANENASEDMSRILSNIETIQKAANVAVAIVHHKNAAGEKPRGHTSLYANADSALEVIRDKTSKSRSFKIAKVKDGLDGQTIGFRLQTVVLGSYDDGKSITSCVVEPAQDGSARTGDRPGGNPLTSMQIAFLRVLRQITAAKGVEVPPSLSAPAGARGVLWPEFLTAYMIEADPEKSDEAVKKQAARDGDKLLNRAMIGRAKPYLWLTDKGDGWP